MSFFSGVGKALGIGGQGGQGGGLLSGFGGLLRHRSPNDPTALSTLDRLGMASAMMNGQYGELGDMWMQHRKRKQQQDRGLFGMFPTDGPVGM